MIIMTCKYCGQNNNAEVDLNCQHCGASLPKNPESQKYKFSNHSESYCIGSLSFPLGTNYKLEDDPFCSLDEGVLSIRSMIKKYLGLR